jgi:outer membrane receptor protein involved in Fe transport
VRWNDDLSTYASFSRGYKAGGFNLDRAALTVGAPNADTDLQFREETVNSYELGAKFRSPDRTVNVNAAAFYSKFDDFQLNTFNGISFVVENLPKVESYGFELEGAWQATENLSFNGGVTYANTQYGNDLGDDPIFQQPDDMTSAGALFQLAGQQITNAPKWSLVGSSTYEHPIGDKLKGLLHLNFRYTSKINTGSDLDLEKVQNGVFVMNGRLGLGHIDDNWQIEIWSRNIFDKDYIQIAFDAPLQGSGTARNTFVSNTQTFNAFLAEPRTFGVTLRGRF